MADPSLVVAARRQLVADVGVLAVVGSSRDYDAWVFTWEPYVPVKNTGLCSIVLRVPAASEAPNLHNTMEFPRLQLTIYADPTRDPKGEIAARDAEDKAYAVWKAADRVLHVPQCGVIVWGNIDGTLRILHSTRQAGYPEIVDVPDGDGVVRGLMDYTVHLG